MKMKNKEIAELIEKLREDLGLTQKELADSLGVTKPAVCQWERGDGIKTSNLYMLSKFFDITMEELCDGKLKSESNDEYIERNYDLSRYYFDGAITDDKLHDLEEFYFHVQLVKDKFMELLPKWAYGTIDDNEFKAFKKIKKYFRFDANYMSYIKSGPNYYGLESSDDEIEFLKEKLNGIKNLTKEEKKWELSKLYDFVFDIKMNEVCESGSMIALQDMLNILNQPLKDSLLNKNFYVDEEKEEASLFGYKSNKIRTKRELKIYEIEKINYFKVMLNSGCNFMLKWQGMNTIYDKDDLKLFDGSIKEIPIRTNEILDNISKFSNFAGQDDLTVIKNWKYTSLNEYKQYVDCAKTEYLKALVNKKDSDPLGYYYALRKYYE